MKILIYQYHNVEVKTISRSNIMIMINIVVLCSSTYKRVHKTSTQLSCHMCIRYEVPHTKITRLKIIVHNAILIID